MTQPIVFISYSHEDEKEKDQLLAQLDVLQRAGLIGLWSDDQIGAGADWEAEINQAITQAKVAILLVSANFLTSDFILGKEVPPLLRRCESEGLIIFPVIAKACAWRNIDWLSKMDVRPKNSRPIWSGSASQIDEGLAAIAEEVALLVNASKPDLRNSAHPVSTPSLPEKVPSVDISGNVMIGAQVVRVWRDSVRLARNWLWGKQRLEVKKETSSQSAPPSKKGKTKKREK